MKYITTNKQGFLLYGKPKAVQSFRLAVVNGFARKFQPKEQIEWKNWIRLQVSQRLDPKFKMIEDQPIEIEVAYMYAPPKSWSKKKMRTLEEVGYIWKTTKPDVSDNLNKGLIDALTGLLWRDDSLIVDCHAKKYYSQTEGIFIEISTYALVDDVGNEIKI